MAVLLEVTLNYTYSNQQFVNRWNYVGTGTPAAVSMSFGLMAAMGFHPAGGAAPSGSILEAIKFLLNPLVAFEQAICINPYDPVDFDAEPFVPQVHGSYTGDGEPPFIALGFRTNQVRRDIRRGYKRFGGLSEGLVNAGGGIDTSLTEIVSLANKMGATLTYDDSGNTLTFVPAIVKKEKYAVPGTSPVRYAFRYLRPLDNTGRDAQIALTAQGVNWEPYTTARSQTSRQYGRGI